MCFSSDGELYRCIRDVKDDVDSYLLAMKQCCSMELPTDALFDSVRPVWVVFKAQVIWVDIVPMKMQAGDLLALMAKKFAFVKSLPGSRLWCLGAQLPNDCRLGEAYTAQTSWWKKHQSKYNIDGAPELTLSFVNISILEPNEDTSFLSQDIDSVECLYINSKHRKDWPSLNSLCVTMNCVTEKSAPQVDSCDIFAWVIQNARSLFKIDGKLSVKPIEVDDLFLTVAAIFYSVEEPAENEDICLMLGGTQRQFLRSLEIETFGLTGRCVELSKEWSYAPPEEARVYRNSLLSRLMSRLYKADVRCVDVKDNKDQNLNMKCSIKSRAGHSDLVKTLQDRKLDGNVGYVFWECSGNLTASLQSPCDHDSFMTTLCEVGRHKVLADKKWMPNISPAGQIVVPWSKDVFRNTMTFLIRLREFLDVRFYCKGEPFIEMLPHCLCSVMMGEYFGKEASTGSASKNIIENAGIHVDELKDVSQKLQNEFLRMFGVKAGDVKFVSYMKKQDRLRPVDDEEAEVFAIDSKDLSKISECAKKDSIESLFYDLTGWKSFWNHCPELVLLQKELNFWPTDFQRSDMLDWFQCDSLVEECGDSAAFGILISFVNKISCLQCETGFCILPVELSRLCFSSKRFEIDDVTALLKKYHLSRETNKEEDVYVLLNCSGSYQVFKKHKSVVSIEEHTVPLKSPTAMCHGDWERCKKVLMKSLFRECPNEYVQSDRAARSVKEEWYKCGVMASFMSFCSTYDIFWQNEEPAFGKAKNSLEMALAIVCLHSELAEKSLAEYRHEKVLRKSDEQSGKVNDHDDPSSSKCVGYIDV